MHLTRNKTADLQTPCGTEQPPPSVFRNALSATHLNTVFLQCKLLTNRIVTSSSALVSTPNAPWPMAYRQVSWSSTSEMRSCEDFFLFRQSSYLLFLNKKYMVNSIFFSQMQEKIVQLAVQSSKISYIISISFL